MPKVERILCIDGVDGCGKGTVTKMIKKRLEAEGHSVALIEPPFYHTRPGQIVKSYLMRGYGDIQDRRIASMLYSFDRNMWYMKHFDEVFKSEKYDTVIYNRNWLSNVFFQTTLICQSPEDTLRFEGEKFMLIPGRGKAPINITLAGLHDTTKVNREPALLDNATLEILDENINPMNDYSLPAQRLMLDAYRFARTKKVQDMIQYVYDMEIMPWHINRDDKPFTSDCYISTIVLTPVLNDAYMRNIYENLMKRYQGDESQFDRNEQSARYLFSVVENIHWIKRNFDQVMGVEPIKPLIAGKSPWLLRLPNTPDPIVHDTIDTMSMDIQHAFDFNIIHTSETGTDNQRDINEIADEVYTTLMTSGSVGL